jgi:hypothetical protein
MCLHSPMKPRLPNRLLPVLPTGRIQPLLQFNNPYIYQRPLPAGKSPVSCAHVNIITPSPRRQQLHSIASGLRKSHPTPQHQADVNVTHWSHIDSVVLTRPQQPPAGQRALLDSTLLGLEPCSIQQHTAHQHGSADTVCLLQSSLGQHLDTPLLTPCTT